MIAMNVVDCKVNCEFFQLKKTGEFNKGRSYRCLSEKAPKKTSYNPERVPGYGIYRLKECPEGYV